MPAPKDKAVRREAHTPAQIVERFAAVRTAGAPMERVQPLNPGLFLVESMRKPKPKVRVKVHSALSSGE